MDLSLGMKYTNMIIVAILALRFLIKLRFPANTLIDLYSLHRVKFKSIQMKFRFDTAVQISIRIRIQIAIKS